MCASAVTRVMATGVGCSSERSCAKRRRPRTVPAVSGSRRRYQLQHASRSADRTLCHCRWPWRRSARSIRTSARACWRLEPRRYPCSDNHVSKSSAIGPSKGSAEYRVDFLGNSSLSIGPSWRSDRAVGPMLAVMCSYEWGKPDDSFGLDEALHITDRSPLVDAEQGDAGEAVDEFAGGAIGERGIQVGEEVLGLDEQGPVAVLERLEHEPGGQAGLAHAGGPDEDDVGGGGDEGQLGEAPDLALVDRRLFLEGECLQRPPFGQPGLADAPFQGALLAVMPLGADKPQGELGVGPPP